MINETLYNRTVSILVDAYFNDTLVHGNCSACAVGNIVAANCGYKLIRSKGIFTWKNKDGTLVDELLAKNGWGEPIIMNNKNLLTNEGLYQIESTGYSFEQLNIIESAFEFRYKEVCNTPRGNYMFNGLMAVIDVLDEIHENNNTELTDTTKLKFQKVCNA